MAHSYSEPLCLKFSSKLWTFRRLSQRLASKIQANQPEAHRGIRKEARKRRGWVSVFSEVEDGEYIIRNENCLLVEALDDLEDKELVYVICCHGDSKYAEMQNEHFVLTRHYTIAEGDPYCDKVFHDTRIDKKITHPSKEFLDNIWPRA